MVPFADEIAIEAEAVDPDPGGRVTRVEYFATNPETGEVRSLGAVGSAPFVIAWNEAEAGRYTLTARATDDQGAFKDSDPVEIVVGIACGKVAILGRAGGAEVSLLERPLFDAGVYSVTLDPALTGLEQLAEFDLVIWDDFGGVGPRDADVQLLGRLLSPELSKALYLITDASTLISPALGAPARLQWSDLLHLRPDPGVGGAGLV